jgi:hypothetical protein
LAGADGLWITGNFLDCSWVEALTETLNVHRERLVSIQTPIVFNFNISKDLERFISLRDRSTGEEPGTIHSAPGCAYRLHVSYPVRRASGKIETAEWEQMLRCLPFGIPYVTGKRFTPAELHEQTEALVASFFLEAVGPSHPARSSRGSACRIPENVPDNIVLKTSGIMGNRSCSPLMAEIEGYFRSAGDILPPEIRRLEIKFRTTCIRSMKEYGRRRPSRTGICAGDWAFLPKEDEVPAIGLEIRALDARNRNRLFLIFPGYKPIAYEDTILVPHRDGAFTSAMMRMRAELKMQLRTDTTEEDVPRALPRAAER